MNLPLKQSKDLNKQLQDSYLKETTQQRNASLSSNPSTAISTERHITSTQTTFEEQSESKNIQFLDVSKDYKHVILKNKQMTGKLQQKQVENDLLNSQEFLNFHNLENRNKKDGFTPARYQEEN